METVDVLRNALEIMRQQGMAKFVLQADDTFSGERYGKIGAVCMNGALNIAHHGDHHWCIDQGCGDKYKESWDAATRALRRVISEQYPERSALECVAIFNNHSDTTFEDVERVFEKAILAEEEAL